MIAELKYSSSCERYVSEISETISELRKFKDKPPILMLSGGVDSLLLGAITRKKHKNFESITVAGLNTEDIKIARQSAYQLGIDNTIIQISLDEIFDNLHLAKGKDIKTVFSLQAYLMLVLAFKKFSVSGFDLLMGTGGDNLLGSTDSFMYLEANKIAKELGISKNEARTICKQRYFQKSISAKKPSGAGHLFRFAAVEAGGHPVQPFKNERLFWVNDLPYEFARPDKKLFNRKAISSLGFNSKMAKRITMQQGTGLYKLIQRRLMSETGAQNPNAAVPIILGEE